MSHTLSVNDRLLTSARDTKERILEAAASQFAARGFRASTMREIATSAKINEVTIYKYFPRKQDLCWKAVDWKMRNVNAREFLVCPLTKAAAPREQLADFCAAVLDLFSQEPTLARLLYFTSLELDPAERKTIFSNHVKPILTALLIRLRAWIESGEIRPVDPETAAIAIVGVLLSQVQFRELLGPLVTHNKLNERLGSEYANLCLAGLQPSALPTT